MRPSSTNKGHNTNVQGNMNSSPENKEFQIDKDAQSCLLDTATNSPIELSSTDLDALIFMYQEEKLAMDVYNNPAQQLKT